MGPAIAQGVEIALSGHDRADAAGDVGGTDPRYRPAGRPASWQCTLRGRGFGGKSAGFRRSVVPGARAGGACSKVTAIYRRNGPICRTIGPFLIDGRAESQAVLPKRSHGPRRGANRM